MDKEIHNRAHNKAFAKVLYLADDIKRARKEIKSGGDGRISMDLLQSNLERLKVDLKVWEYIAQLVEDENLTEPIKSNVEMLHGIMGLADPSLYDMDIDYEIQSPS
jgi:hypothetical protein